MVLLTITPPILESLEWLRREIPPVDGDSGATAGSPSDARLWDNRLDNKQDEYERQHKTESEPLLENPEVGNPISHGQIIDLSRALKTHGISSVRLESLLRGTKVYVPPPAPKKETTSEYKTLMARLRAEEESRSYARMTSLPTADMFSVRSSISATSYALSPGMKTSDTEDDVTYADVDRQIALIFNVLVSIVACAGAIWMAARWWSTPARLALSMSGSLLVGIAEVVVYSGYIRRVAEAKVTSKKLREVKEVINTWVVGEDSIGTADDNDAVINNGRQLSSSNEQTRRRIVKKPST